MHEFKQTVDASLVRLGNIKCVKTEDFNEEFLKISSFSLIAVFKLHSDRFNSLSIEMECKCGCLQGDLDTCSFYNQIWLKFTLPLASHYLIQNLYTLKCKGDIPPLTFGEGKRHIKINFEYLGEKITKEE